MNKRRRIPTIEGLEPRQLATLGVVSSQFSVLTVDDSAVKTTLGPRGMDVATFAVSEGTKA